MRTAAQGVRRRSGGGLSAGLHESHEQGFTLVELILGMLLFSFIAYASISLIRGSFDTIARLLAEFDSRKRVLMLQREMAEGAADYAGYLAASNISFGPGEGGLEGTCVFRFEFPDYSDGRTRSIEYVWRPDVEAIFQRVDEGDFVRLLGDVAGFAVTKKPGDAYTIRVTIAHRVKGFANPIVRTTEGQARNMDLRSGALASAIKECVVT